MYAAAGGASIANRRKQKRLQLSKQPVNVVLPKSKGALPALRHHHLQHHQYQHQCEYHSHHHHHHPCHSSKLTTRPHKVTPHISRVKQQRQAPTSTSSSSVAFHSIVDDRRRHIVTTDRSQQPVAPISPIHFPISPPPLSLESSVSATTSYHPADRSSKFPFPPPSILDLQVSPPSELQVGTSSNIFSLSQTNPPPEISHTLS